MQKILLDNKDFINSLWEKIEKKVNLTADRIQDTMPYTTKNGLYVDAEPISPAWWTNSFWAGLMWLMYKETKVEKYKTYAEGIENKMDAVLMDYDGLHHDVGFMWLLTSVFNYETTGNEKSRKRAMLAASTLSSRANIAGNYIRAWNGDMNGRAIIDCMMNIPLLHWASEKSKDARFSHIANMHADKTIKEFIRDDGSVNHIVDFDPADGTFLDNPAGQGYKSGSSWSRGQSWAIYGFIQSYQWTKDANYLNAAKRIAHYVLSNLGQTDYLVPCDYRQPADSHLLDSSAAAITACGLIEIAKSVDEAEKGLYLSSAMHILKTLDEKCAIWDMSDEALLTNGTSQFHLNSGIWEVENSALIYGDYYFVEAVCKLRKLL